MAQRTTTGLVQKLLARNWDGKTDVQQCIDIASPIVDQVVVMAAQRCLPLPTGLQEIVERHLSCMYYCRLDRMLQSKSTGGASGQFIAPKNDAEVYKQSAIEADYSGSLNSLLNRLVARGFWLGQCDPCCAGTG